MSVGTDKKSLEPYDPNSYRNHLPIIDAKRLHKNLS